MVRYFRKLTGKNHVKSWQLAALCLTVGMLILRLRYIGSVELFPEEAYYWLYSKHLALGYLDHPPMVGWIIWLFTTTLGDTEFAVRLGAYALWMVTAAFCFYSAKNLFNKPAAYAAMALLSTFPFFFVTGFLMTPDAPLTACWAGALYFLERALLDRKGHGWTGVGVCIGLGLLSKYTIVLLIPAALLFMLLDRQSRSWLARPAPYVALVVIVLLFLPDLIWNYEHHWTSFVFQGSRRFMESSTFNLPHLIGSILVLLTPVGALAALSGITRKAIASESGNDWDRRKQLFIATFTIFPLLVFLLFSLGRETKLNWTGPLWLAVIPQISRDMIAPGPFRSRLDKAMSMSWPPTFICLILLYSFFLPYLAAGTPYLSRFQPINFDYIVGWKNLASQIESIEDKVENITGVEPYVIGMDKNKIASELAFYRNRIRPKGEGLYYTTGRHIFGEDSLMFQYWTPKINEQANKKDQVLILVSRELPEFDRNHISSWGWRLGSIKELDITDEHGTSAGKYFYAFALPKDHLKNSMQID